MPCRRPRHRRTHGGRVSAARPFLTRRGGPPGPTPRLLRPAGPPFLGPAARPLTRVKARTCQPTESPRRFAEEPVSADASPTDAMGFNAAQPTVPAPIAGPYQTQPARIGQPPPDHQTHNWPELTTRP